MTATRKRASLTLSFADNLRVAGHALIASPGYSFPALLSLILGIGATTVICALFNAVTFRPLPFAHEEGLAVVFDELDAVGEERMPISAPEMSDYARLSQSIASLAAVREADATVTGLGMPRHVRTAHCTLNWFETIGVTPKLGRGFRSTGSGPDDVGSAVISFDFWISALGGAPAIGRMVVVEGIPRTIVGVLAKEQSLPAGAALWIPLHLTDEQATHRGYRFLFAVARLKSVASVEAAQRELDVVSQNIQAGLGARGRRVRAVLVPLREQLLSGDRAIMRFMLAAVAVFLLLVCTNVALLLLTRASVRNHELAVRAALGASPLRLVRESLAEALLLVVVGGAMGMALAMVALHTVARVYADLLAYAMPELDGTVVLLFILTCLMTVVVIAAAPALRAARIRSMDALRQGGRTSSSPASRRLRELLVALQVAAGVVLLIGASSLIRSVWALTKVDPGFSTDGVVVGRISLPTQKYGGDEQIRQFYERALESLHSMPNTQAIAAVSLLPLADEYGVRVTIEGRSVSGQALAEQRTITPEYFRAIGIPLRAGRMLSSGDRVDTEPVAVVNQTFAQQLLGTSNPLGKRFNDGSKDARGEVKWLRVVGVVTDSRDFGLDVPARRTFFIPFAQAPEAEMSLIARGSGNGAELLQQMPRRVQTIDSDLPMYSLTTLREIVETSYRSRTVLAYLLIVFSAAALLLASIGLFGVTSYSVSQRVPELAIRRAVGASQVRVLMLVLSEMTIVVGLGVLAGIVGAWFVSRLMTTLMFGVTASDPVTVVGAGLVAFVVSLLATLPPAQHAASVSPAVSLKGG